MTVALINNGIVEAVNHAIDIPPAGWIVTPSTVICGQVTTDGGKTFSDPPPTLDEVLEDKTDAVIARMNKDICTALSVKQGTDLGLLVLIYEAMATPTAPMVKAKSIWDYAHTLIANAANYTLAQLQAYDPNTDPNWPT